MINKRKIMILVLAIAGKDALYGMNQPEMKRGSAAAVAADDKNLIVMPDDIRRELEKGDPDYKIIYDWLAKDPQNIHAKDLLVKNFRGLWSVNPNQRENFIIQLVEKGADVNQTLNGISALMLAVEEGKLDIVQKLLQYGARINYENHNSMTALTWALSSLENWAGKGDQLLPIIKLLIQNGAQVNHKTKDTGFAVGKTPLMFAFSLPNSFKLESLEVKKGIIAARLQAARLLLENGADPDAVDTRGQSVMQYAEKNSPEAVKLIQEFQKLAQERAVESKASGEELEDKIPKPIIGIVKEYIEVSAGKKATLNHIKKAIREGSREELGYLMLEKGNLELADEAGYTPLLEAIYANKPELVKLLLELGADKNARLGSDKDGFNALELAQRLGRVEIIKLLSSK